MSELKKCQEVMVQNARTCLQQPDLYLGQDPRAQFIQLYQEEEGGMLGVCRLLLVVGDI